jgi:GNAT superfamily N-acetyltransferase
MERPSNRELLAALRSRGAGVHADWGEVDDSELLEIVSRASEMEPWDGQTRPLPGPIEIRPLEAGRLADYERFFDRTAFMDNALWSGCYCHFYCFPGTKEQWQKRRSAENRVAQSELIRRGTAQGYLAYAGDKVIGWCNAAPRSMLPGLEREAELRTGDTEGIGSIVCFVVAAPYRGQGVAKRLLDRACEGLRARALTIAEAYPRSDEVSSSAAYHGPLTMYLEAGFEPYRDEGAWTIVRKRLA